ncbi:histidine phosphatase family protein [Lysinibacillus yapensis]|uniref:Histidine phosphatase family protein n=1 Tax=Ureibacillus yapensis TaxID=2304605 RepID=A0A396SL89_9BACL|nr:histidine phosphatase family protein [Lysinibacillus yapensis]RHW36150.1 histidine phosphatase family protein [Lysinibacillus yapensis]
MEQSLLNSLRKGGYIFYARHGEATVGNDLPFLNFQDCFTQRNLSEKGRQQAISYGEVLRQLQIPIQAPVSASPFCRNIETAQMAFGKSSVQVNPFWFEVYRLSGNLLSDEQQRILTTFNSVMEIVPKKGKNKVIVAHTFPKGLGLGDIPYMGTVLIKPKGEGKGYDVIKRLSLGDLNKLGG